MSVDFSSRLAGLTPAQRALFELALKKKERERSAPAQPATERVQRRPHGSRAPLSVDQERLWFIQQLTPASPAYNVYGADRFRGPLDVAVLVQALNELVRRHEVLRSTFPAVDGKPVQEIAPQLTIRIPLVDLRGLPEDRREEAAERAASQAVSVPFDLARLPLLRLVLVRVAEEDHVCAIAIHHIVTDWISYYAMAGELATLYGAFLAGRPSPLPELEVQFADFAIWQRERLADAAWMAEELAWWRERLEGAPDLLPLPYDRPRPPVQTPWGTRRRLTLSRAQSDAFRSFARREGVTLFILGLAAFQTLLMRLTGEEKLVVGTPSAGRPGPEMQSVLGFFLNQLALYSDLTGNPPFRHALRRVREVALGAYAHADVPFARVVEAVRPERDLSRTPLIQVIFLLLNFQELERPAMPGIEVEAYWVDARRTAWDMTYSLWELPTGITGWMEYNTDLFDASTIDRMKEQFRTLVGGLLATPDAPVWDLPLLPESQRQQVVAEWPVGGAAAAPARVDELFAAQAARTPEAVALRFRDWVVRYGELDRMADGIAHRLAALGVGPEDVVGVCVERSPEMVAALLAIWKAGAAYLPLDPAYPEERLSLLLADSGAAALIAGAAEAARLGGGWPVVDPHPPGEGEATAETETSSGPAQGGGTFAGEETPDWAAGPFPLGGGGWERGEVRRGAAPATTPAHLAYVLYTSGSTGRPKGVEVSHAALATFLAAMRERPGLGPGDRLLAVTTISFDIAGLEIYLPLVTGAEVVLADRETAADGSLLRAALEESGATVMQATPATWRLLLAAGWHGSDLRVWCGGEALSHELAGELLRRSPEVWNLYGPTETTVWSAVHRVTGQEAGGPELGGAVSIGSPIAGTRLYVLDPYFRPAPAGVAGELAIVGAGVARGYRGRPDLTAERFVPDPFAGRGERLYRTGDLVRWRPAGRIEFLGRIDQQVKVRGFRVEPAEIERALESHPGVVQAAVLARGDRPGERHLAAYVVPKADADLGDWRAFLRRRLPEYMVPSVLVTLERFPSTPNGKVDRRALARLGAEENGAAARGSRPAVYRSALGEVVAAVVADVLDRPAVGPEDDFFQLGGHSLSAFQVVARLRDMLGVELPVAALFAHPTADGLAAELEARLGIAAEAAPPLVPVPHAAGAPLSFAQQRLWFLERLVPDNAFYNMPFAVRIEGALEVAALAAALSEIVRRHEVLRTRFVDLEGRGRPVQIAIAGLGLPLPVLDLAALPREHGERELGRLATAGARRPFDLERAPLVRAALAALGPQEHALLLNLHHIVSDGWSMRVFAAELGAIYSAVAAGRPSPLPELPVQYADYSVWQRSWLAGPVLEGQLRYWRERLAGAPPLLELPLDRPRPLFGSFRGGAETLTLDRSRAERLRSLAARRGATLFMVLLAGWKVLLARYSGQRDVLVGAPIANRTQREVEGLIGFFVNTLVLRTALEGDPSGGELTGGVRETALGAFAHQHLPFEKLVEELAPERDLGHNPLVQVMFSMQNFPHSTPELGGLAVSALDSRAIDAGTSKFDLTLFVWDAAGEEAGLRLLLEYDSDLFDPATVRRLLGHYETLLDALAAAPGLPVSRLPLLPKAERAHILAQGAALAASGPAACLHERFAAWAARSPEAPAVAFEGRTLSYGDLARRARHLAWRLRGLGVGPEVRIALRLERGLDLVTAVLAVLEAGGAYVPLDSNVPEERQAFVLADSGAAVLLDGTGRPLPAGVSGVALVRPDVEEGGEPPGALPGGAVPENTAYVIYTSGSTGRPKGVAVSHANVDRLLSSTAHGFGFGPGDVWTLFHSYAFDFSVWELWGALALGGRLVVVPYLVSRSPRDFYDLLVDEGVTVLNQTPSAFYQLIQVDEEKGRENGSLALRWVIFGGEALDTSRLAGWFARHGDEAPRLVNMYGITETTVHVTWRPLSAADARVRVGSPVGVPIPDLSAHALDAAMEPAPWGVPGELYVGGAGLARGYVGRPELTAERFVPDPFCGETGARLYRSGDLVRRLPDGSLDYLGRIDQQVKIRGFRIELGEIESLLVQHPGVAEAVVLARQDGGEERRLVAYVVQEARWTGVAGRQAGPGLGYEQVAQWREVFDRVYGEGPGRAPEPGLDLTGWEDSAGRRPIPDEEMREWVEDAVARVRDLAPERVLEIGCGTGMLLWRLAPHCRRYVGTDLSERALARLRRQLAAAGRELPQVELDRRPADDLSGLPERSFDAVILHSVAQYFPGVDYLLRVIGGAVRAVRPGGAVFLGDLRSLPLLGAFHAALELEKADDAFPVEQLRRQVETRLAQENELALDPAFFFALPQHLPEVRRVEVLPRRGHRHNELTRFRYHAVLYVGEGGAETPEVTWLDWRREGLTLGELRRRLTEQEAPILALRGIPNARTAAAAEAARRLAEGGVATAGELRRAISGAIDGAVDPQALWDLAAELPYDVELGWSEPGGDGRFEAVLQRRNPAAPARLPLPAPPDAAAAPERPWTEYANNPLRGRLGQRLVPELRDDLAARLPEYMLPAAWVVLEALPLTANGKLDRAALPAPGGARPELGVEYVPPRSFAEDVLAAVWAQVMGLHQVGIYDNFFALGGDSIRSLQVLSLARERGFQIELADLFRYQTIAELAAAVGSPVEGGFARVAAADEKLHVAPFELVSEEDRRRLPEGLEDAYPLTLLQAGMLYHMQATADYPLYHNVDSRSVKLPLDLADLQAAWDRAVARHAALRTGYDLISYSEPLQLVHKTAALPVAVEDLRHLPVAEREARLAAFVQEEKRRLFDLAKPPLFRFHVHRLTDEWLQFTLTECHTVFDGWSLNSTLVEVFGEYLTVLMGGTPKEEPPPRVSFRDYVALERQALASAEQRDFWRRKITAGPITDLPPRFYPRLDPLAGERGPRSLVRTEMPGDVHAGLVRLARVAGVPMKSVCLAAHARAIALITGQSDPLTGFILNGRPETVDGYEVRGMFLNTVPLRLRLDGGTWVELAQAAFAAERELFPYRRYPLPALQQWWGREPLLQSAFNFTHFYIWGQLRAMGWAIETGEGFNQELEENHYPLMVNFNYEEVLSRLRVTIESQMEAGEARRLLAYYERILEAMAADPEGRYDEAGLIPEDELRPLLGEWSAGPEAAAAPPIATQIAVQTARTPDRAALVCGEERLSYVELDRRSGRLARRLRALGAGPEVRVAVALERRPELVVALLAVLRAGAAYVPLDLAHPAKRLAGSIADSGAALLLTRAGWVGKLGELASGALVLAVEDEGGEGAGGAPLPEPDPRSLAYVIYTSGSTGRPKGVGISHGSAAALATWAGEAFSEDELAGVLAATSAGFDLSVFEMFVPLCRGGSVIMAGNALALSDLPARDAVTLLNTVPSAAAELVEEKAVPPSVRTVCLAGEPLRGALVRRIWERIAADRVWNLYGPTEDTTYSTGVLLERGSAGEPPLGRPVAGSRAWVLDERLVPLPAGVPGELCLGGAGVARGYLGRPDATAERFVPDPFSGVPGARLYRTGDRARHRAEGQLEFLGRIDRQVKVRGFRVEPGEVEAALLEHPGVRETAVAVREEPGGENEPDRRLVAYVVPAGRAEPPPPAELRAFLSARLPAAMVPQLFVPLEALPLTANGKLDRRALAALPMAPMAPGPEAAACAAPRSAAEELLAEIWAGVLGRDRIGIHDDFFTLGGHSLLATRVVSRMRSAFGVDVSLRTLFDHPTVARLAAAVEALLHGEGRAAAPELVPLPRSNRAPLSFAQQRLWVLHQLEPESAAYNLPVTVRLLGALDPAALAGSLGEILRRHEALRTTFGQDGDEPVQIVRPDGDFSLPLVDLAPLAARAEAEALRLARAEAQRPFDLARGPLFRPLLLRLVADDHAVVAVLHHIVGDAWSLDVFVREVVALYAAAVGGRPAPLPELPVQYADYALWQRRWLSPEVLAAELAFWRAELRGLPGYLDLPADRPRPPVQTFRGATWMAVLAEGPAGALHGLARSEGATLFMTLLAAFQALLARYTGEEDLAVGIPVSGRNRQEIENLIGFFVNTLVVRGDLRGNPEFRTLLRRVREATLAAQTHQDLPFEKLVEELQPQRDLSRSPLFQVMFAFQSVAETASAPGLEVRPLALEWRAALFDLTLTVRESGAGLVTIWEYSTALFENATIARLAEHFRTLVAAAVDHPAQRLSALPLLSAAERAQLVGEWNDTRAALPAATTVVELIEAQARRAPESLAIAGRWGEVSYGELDRRAGRLARHLRALGAGPEVRVGICLERSPEALVALLAVLKSGGAFVPLDPAYPRQRLEFLLADSGMALLVTSGRLAQTLASGAVPAVRIDAVLPEEAAGAAAPPPLLGDHPAYAIYTSGSTGLPKGTSVSHRSLLTYAAGFAERLDIAPGERFLQFAPLSFDVAIEEVIPSWAAGATVVLEEPDRLASVAELGPTLAAWQVTLLELPTLFWLEWDDHLRRSGERPPACLRRLLVGGEAVPADPMPRWLGWGVELQNVFGLTETTVTTTLHAAGAGDTARPDLPLGRPIPNARVYVLDRGLQPAPVGVPGEIFVGGDGVARGYLGRPDLTAERFVPDPFGGHPDVPGQRLFRTGDLGRWLAGGVLDFLGRRDQQVKIRGFRVEIGEVEAALASHPEVRQAAVVARPGVDRRPRLVAYVAGRAGTDELLAWLRRRLPDPMVPAVVVPLANLPLSPTSKVDRGALPDPEPSRPAVAAPPPRGPVEEALAAIWAEVLGVERVMAADDFFALGGHSLLATRAISRLRGAFGIELPLRALFEEPTVAGLARCVEREMERTRGVAVPPVYAADHAGPMPLSFAQERLWFLDQLEPGTAAYNIPLAVRLTGRLDLGAFAGALSEIARRHGALRTTFETAGGEPVQVVAPPQPLAPPLVDLSGLPPEIRVWEERRRVAAEVMRPFDLARGPLFRVLLLKLAENVHTAAATLHHIVSDGWSMEIFVREVTALYQAAHAGRPSPLPELPIQYTDYAAWQRRCLTGRTLAQQLAYWTHQLAGAPGALDLPAEHPRPPVQTYRGAAQGLVLSPELSAGLRRLGGSQGVTPFMTVLAALGALFYRYTGQDDIVLGSPIAGRNRQETEGLIGFFLNTLALRLDLSGDPTFRQLLGRVREVTLGAYTHQDLPFERLLEELRPARDVSRTPLFQVMVNWDNAAQTRSEPLQLPDLVLELLPDAEPIAKFDLEVYAEELGDCIALNLVYNRDLFGRTQMADLVRHLETLLAAAVAEPEHRLSDLVLEARTGPASPRSLACEGSVADRLFLQAAAHPDRVALRTPDEEAWTYGALALAAGRVAHGLLAACGAGPDRIALLFAPGGPMAAAVLGTLAAGKAYVPLDPADPPERLRFLLADSGAAAVLAGPELARDFTAALPVLDYAALPAPPAGWSAPRVAPEAAAYLLYTSGSTGEPKGVMQSQANVLHHALTYAGRLGFDAGDRLSLLPSYGFDAAVMDLFGGLLSGAEVCPWDVKTRGAEGLAAWLAEREITVYHSTPTLYRYLLESLAGSERFPALRWVVLGGEEARRSDFEGFLRTFGPRCRLVNGLGPTESTLALQAFFDHRSQVERHGLPVGAPVAGTEVLLWNGAGRQVAAWGAGEILIRSPHLALGYWRRPDLTADAFRPDPEGGGLRVYRTGDFGRLLPDGAIEFVGRRDLQAKIRGIRVEPGEVEAALARCAGVRQAAVVLRQDPRGEPRLVAYVAVREGVDLEPSDLRADLAVRLPAALVPAAFVLLPDLPLTSTGKIDRRALARMEPPPEVRADGGATWVGPRDEIEAILAAIWSELLGVARIGVHDSFFELGGHSLLATRVLARVRAAFGVVPPLRDLFAEPTVAGTAAAIARERDRAAPAPTMKLAARPRRERRLRREELDRER